MAIGIDRVRFNVGGMIFETSTATLANAGRGSMLGALLDEDWNLIAGDGAGAEYFIDRNPECFSVLLDFLRSDELHLPPHIPDKLFYREALYYGLLDHVRSARWGPFDGDRLHLASSIYSRAAPSHATAIRASPDGGCCVAHGNVIHIYDWMLDEHSPINLDYQPVTDAGYVDSGHIVVAVRDQSNCLSCAGGMGLFSSSSGELLHRFRIFHDNKAKDFTAGALSFSDSQSKIFASCTGSYNEYGIGVWDQNTGEQSDFFYEPPGCSFGDANKLQWIEGDSLLMAATMSQTPRINYSYIGIVDFREKNLVWSWTDEGTMEAASLDDTAVLHAIVMEDKRSICVVNQYEDLGFLDLRSNRGGVRWGTNSSVFKGMFAVEKTSYQKLAMNGGKLFSLTNHSISVFCRPDWVRTSIYRSVGSSICDFSIGGDRLFSLHNEANVFDVWESPRVPLFQLS